MCSSDPKPHIPEGPFPVHIHSLSYQKLLLGLSTMGFAPVAAATHLKVGGVLCQAPLHLALTVLLPDHTCLTPTEASSRGVACQLGSRNSVRTEVCNLKAMAKWIGNSDDAEATPMTKSPQGLGWFPERCRQRSQPPAPSRDGKNSSGANRISLPGPLPYRDPLLWAESGPVPQDPFYGWQSSFTYCYRLNCVPLTHKFIR